MKRRSLWDAIPRRMWLPLGFGLFWNMVTYYATRLFNTCRYHYDFTMELDEMIPMVPWTVLIYFSCFVFWGVSYVLCAWRSPERAYRFYCADFIGKTVALIFFLALPTTNVRPPVEGSGVFSELMRMLYAIDPADNLFPSLHCLISWICFRGVSGDKTVWKWYRVFACLYCFAIFAVTLTTKQHVIWDVIGGVVFGELSFLLAGIPAVRKTYTRLLSPETYRKRQA